MTQKRDRPPGGGRRRLTAEDWADEALAAIGEGGLAAVAVEPLAVRLGTTKGSFYWHFDNRDALVEAALRRWEETRTEAVITSLAEEPDPLRRLRGLFARSVGRAVEDRLEVTLLATSGHPQVAAVLRRVAERRIGYLTQIFTELGFPPQEARRRGLLCYTVYLGHAQLNHAIGEALPSGEDLMRHLDEAVGTLVRPS